LNLAEALIPNFPVKLAIPSFIKPQIAGLMYKTTSISAFFMGVVVGLFEFPCTGGPYLMILSLLHDSSTILTGTFYLIYYNLIFVSPLVLIMILGSSQLVTGKLQSWRKQNSKVTSVVTALATLALGVIIFLI
jgi:cytochrome c biogenesis protein CcdA